MPAHHQNRTLVAKGCNISDNGICIYTFKPLEEGQEITFKNALPVAYSKAAVKWVKQCNPGIYKAGVSFTA